ncbi:hypothetical protein OSB04_014629 [Centaurea solstitialis]|uniref:Peptidase S10, serine carboxypeptidase, Alpha/Beta hydrolase fold protein n=1 Tax=Centaurea solstitialis TaxID=347529 RepID=A0AA38SZ20_9ASTR|nr:hypothetical protein OSB04_014629 [Centaurea solstitialis]
MKSRPRTMKFSFLFILTLQFHLMHSKSIITRLPGYHGDLPFKLETGYIGIGKNQDVQLFYYFVESTRNPEEDPLIFYVPGGPGASALITFLYEIGPLNFDLDNNQDNMTLILNPNSWLQMANIIFVDMPAGSGYSYSNTEDGWISSDSIVVTQANEFIKKFLIDHTKFLKNPLYIAGISYIGIAVPKIILEIYEGNERGDQPALNIQFNDFNSRLEYAYRMALISEDIHKSAIENCHGNYVKVDTLNALCANSLHRYKQCTHHINLDNILEPFCDENDSTSDCEDTFNKVVEIWANNEVVQQALDVRQGKIGKWELLNDTMHYNQGKNDTVCYAYDIFSSFSYHKQLSSKNCRALILSGDHDMTFPYVGVEQWITSLNIGIEIPWKPFYVDGQVGGYQVKYAQNDYSMTFTTVKGAGHLVPHYKPKETMAVIKTWFSPTYSSDC